MPEWLDRNAWPWEARSHEGPDGRQHFIDVGDGAPFLFSHGTPTWSFEWRHLIAGLQDRARCIAVDHLGFGLSDRPEGAGYTPEDHARRFAHFADALDLQGATLVIHDYGGPIALRWILDHPERVARVVLLNTFGWPLDDDWKIRWGSRLLASPLGRWMYGSLNVSLNAIAPSAWADRSGWDAVSHQYHPVFPDPSSRTRVLWPLSVGLLGSRAFYAGLERDLHRLQDIPVDVVWGTRDTAFGTAYRDRWMAILPHAHRLDLESAGHWPHEEDPAPIANLLAPAKFLA